MDKRGGILIVSVMILVLGFVGTASATNWSVDGSGGADFTGIQEAINNASVGDTIIVYSGVYYENVVVNKSVTLKGIGHPVVDAGGERSAITLSADGITLVGFKAINSGRAWSDVGIKVTSNNNTITGNNVSSNNRDGIRLYYSSNNTITGNNASNNNRYGIHIFGSSNNIITGNNASNNNKEGICIYGSSSNNTITGNNVCNNNRDGICIYDYSSNNTITGNNVCNNNRYGIHIFGSSNNNTITGNNVCNNNRDGIHIYNSSNNTITGNIFVNDGLSVCASYHNTVEDNTVNGKPLVYLEDVSDYKVEGAGQVILVNCTSITVEKLDLCNTSVGIALWKTENSKISNNTVCNNKDGIRLSYSRNNNTITGNNVCNNKYKGIRLDHSGNNIITGNNVCNNNQEGIFLYVSRNNIITGNNVCNNEFGIDLNSAKSFIFTGEESITIYYHSSNNIIYFNNFINNTDNVDYYKSTNIWNSPLEITYTYDGTTYKSYLGNYRDDYEGTDAEGDGIGDQHYSIDSKEDESDDYPLMKPFGNYNLTTSAPA